jgi:hypothetical protein
MDKKPTLEERTLHAIQKLSMSVDGVSGTLERLYNDWKFPVKTMAEHMAPEWKEQEERERFEKELRLLKKQNKILIVTVIVSVIGLLLTAFASLADIYLRVFLNK